MNHLNLPDDPDFTRRFKRDIIAIELIAFGIMLGVICFVTLVLWVLNELLCVK